MLGFLIMKKRFIENLNKLNINKKSTILLCVSGGKDSICMLDLFYKINSQFEFNLIVAHFNHSLRKNSDEDELFVSKIASNYGFKFYSKKEDVENFCKINKYTIEEGARFLRYKFFDEVSKKENVDYISTAHNKNDNVETVIMRILRGTGINGLCGIPKLNKNLIRPMLIFDINEINNYIKVNNLKIVEDYTNKIDIYHRNKIRLNLIPSLEMDYNSNLVNAVDRLSEISSNYVEVVRDYINQKEGYLFTVEENLININIELLSKEKISFKNILFREFFERINKSSDGINHDFIENINCLLNSETGKYLIIKDVIFEVSYGNLKIYKVDKNFQEDFDFYYENLDFSLYSTNFFDIIIEHSNYDEFLKNKKNKNILFLNKSHLNNLKIRNRKNGDYIVLNFGKKKLKDIFIDEKIDRNLREHIPIFELNNEIIWVSNIKRSSNYLVSSNDEIIKITSNRR